jgi:hypothetical protein
MRRHSSRRIGSNRCHATNGRSNEYCRMKESFSAQASRPQTKKPFHRSLLFTLCTYSSILLGLRACSTSSTNGKDEAPIAPLRALTPIKPGLDIVLLLERLLSAFAHCRQHSDHHDCER